MEAIIISSVLLFFGYAIYSKFIAPILKGDNSLHTSDEDGLTDSDFIYERPKINPTTGNRMLTSSIDTAGKIYGQV